MMRAPQPGDRIGRYRIDSLVTQGGMASVFRGTDERTGKPVAIKIPHLQYEMDVLFFDRFQREANIGRKLDHPGVVKVLPAEDDGRVCMIMEWVEGRPLRNILDEEKKLSPERAERIAIRICDALGYIHDHGVVHRDLKPDNIMVDETRPDQADRLWHRRRGAGAAADVLEIHQGDGDARLRLAGAGERQAR